ncbi:unnamed protein product [Peniophora sp. CBMAI 1063]|nr:unnamed protein product [Peniophora sp. CBMAI 1063]
MGPAEADTLAPDGAYWTQALDLRLSTLSKQHRLNQRTLKDDMRSVRLMMHDLELRHNALSLACQLPVEILLLIFRLLATSEREEWLPVSQVCHYWRDVSLSDGSLWARVYVRSPSLWDLFVQRAQGQPLHVHVYNHGTWALWLEAAMKKDIESIQTLHIECPKLEYLEPAIRCPVRLVDALNTMAHAPRLRSLTVQRSIDGCSSQIDLGPHTLSSIPTQLEHIELRRIPFPWTAEAHHLHRLHVENIAQPVNIVLLGLQALPNLSHAYLQFENTSHAVPASDAMPTVVMAHIRDLVVGGAVAACTIMCRNIRLPPSAKMSVNVSSYREDVRVDDIRRLAKSAARQIQRLNEATSITVTAHAEHRSMIDIHVRGFRASPHGQADLRNVEISIPCFRISFELCDATNRVSPKYRFKVLRRMMASSEKTRWSALDVFGKWHLPLMLHEVVRPAVHLSALAMGGASHSMVKSALHQLQPELHSNEPAPIVFPALRHLTLSRMSLGCDHSECDGDDALIHSLRGMLNARKNDGYPLSTLELKECSIAREYAILFKLDVENLIWDGREGDAHERHMTARRLDVN